MFLQMLLIFVFWPHLDAHFPITISKVNKKHLENIINTLNGEKHDIRDNRNKVDLNDEEKEEILQEILWLLRKNYNAAKQYSEGNKPLHTVARLYFIKNPEVLEEYQNYLSTQNDLLGNLQSEEINNLEKRNLKDDLMYMRKSAISYRDSLGRSESFDIDNINTDEGIVKTRKDNFVRTKISSEENDEDSILDHREKIKNTKSRDLAQRSNFEEKNTKNMENQFKAVPKINYKKPKRDESHSFGRTSIPFVVFTITCKCRKYDLEQEAHKLYDESFSAVVQSFRRTPEYLTILQDQFIKMKNGIEIVVEKIETSYKKQLEVAVLNELNVSRSFRAKGDHIKRRQQESPVDSLDNYKILLSYLSVAERNRMKDIAYEYSGKMIHEIMARCSPDGGDIASSTLADGGHRPETTTEHVHKATTTTTSEEPEHVTIATSTSKSQHHHQSTAAPESQRKFKLPKLI